MPHTKEKVAAPEDDKSKAAGEQKPDNKGDAKDTNPSNGQSIEQVAGGDSSKQNDSKVRRARAEIEKDELLDDLKKENREMKKMIRDEVIPTIRDLQQQVKKGGTSANDAQDELDALAKEWDLEPKFVRKLSDILLSKSKKQFEDQYLSDIKDFKSKVETQSKEISKAQISAAIAKEFDRVIAENPDLAKVAKKEAVKKYIISSEENLGRTMEDILDELYGSDKGGAGMEGYSSQGGNHPKEPDYKAPTDEDHKRIAESRERGGQEFDKYQEGLIDRLTHRSRHKK